MGIHHLAWVDNLDTGAIVLVQRHEDSIVAAGDGTMNPSRTNGGSYTEGNECPMKVSPSFDPGVKWAVRTVEYEDAISR